MHKAFIVFLIFMGLSSVFVLILLIVVVHNGIIVIVPFTGIQIICM